MTVRVFVDANVLFSRTLRDWTLMLRLAGPSEMFQLHTTEDVLAETIRSLRRRFPMMNGRSMGEVRARIVESIDELVVDFDASIAYTGKDPNDRHVHAAAVASQADILLTIDKNLLNMPNADELPYEAYSPDDFFILVDDSAAKTVERVTDSQRAFWASKKHHSGLVQSLKDANCPQFAERVNGHLRVLSGVVD